MNTPSTNAPARSFFDVRAILRGIADFFDLLTTAARMSEETSRLMALSDKDLARRGLRREDVVRHVYGLPLID
jgi:hypothetical protein